MTDNEISLNLNRGFCEWSEEPLEDGCPIEYEDKWGKRNQPSYSFLGNIKSLF
jgi:hypothetical protein